MYEGTFRNHLLVKGRSRDSAWFSIVEGEEWVAVRKGLVRWMHEANFDWEGRQKRKLEEFRREVVEWQIARASGSGLVAEP